MRTRTLNSIAFTGYTETDPNAWRLIGNSSTNPSINFIGTTDNVDFVIRTNNIERARVSNVGNVGIGTSSPSQKLTVNGNIGLNAGVNSFIGTLSNTDLLFYTNNGEKMRLTKSGDLYVGSKNDTMRYLFDWMFPQPPGNFSSRVHIKKDYGVAGSNPTIYCPLTITSIDTSNYTPPPIPAHFGTYIEAINKRGSNSVSGETYGIIATAQADTLSKFYRLTGGIFHSYSKSNALTNQSTMTAIAGRINYQGKGFVEKAYGINLLGQNRSSGTLKNYCGFYSMVDNISTGKYDTIVMYYSQVLGRCKASVLYGQQIFLDSQYIKPQKIYGLYILNKSQTVNPNDNWGIALYGFNKNYISGNLDVGGTLTATACICPSDLNLKSHIYPIPYGLKDVLMLKPVAFEWKDNHQHDIGLIAQDVMGVIPEVVRTFSKNSSDSSYYALDYAKLTSVIIKAMQEQQAMIEQQQKISEEQRTIINQQQKEIDLLKKQIQVLSEEIKKLQTTIIANGSASK
ncbi:MAG: tail fiber domain-containing protein [Bacteroidales bacterium]|nr:tail fiber domain-containing protein [Bacteroidales bacterium]